MSSMGGPCRGNPDELIGVFGCLALAVLGIIAIMLFDAFNSWREGKPAPCPPAYKLPLRKHHYAAVY